ncbi:MAG TPA: ATP-binding protein [Candidatus Limnocylindrales bacterium]
MKRWHSTIRVRLTVHYALALLLAGSILIALLYLYLGHALDGQLSAPHMRLRHTPDEMKQIHDHILRAMLIASLISLGLVAVAATGFGWWMAGRALRPLHQITATARRVADRSLHERIALEGPDDEIKDLADTFDGMLERLDRSFDSQRRFVANASHELRTPLTLNRTLIEVTLDDPDTPAATRQLGTTLLTITQRHERLIDGLLTLASSEQGVTEREPVDLADVARHVLDAAAADADAHVEADLRPAAVTGDPVLLERLVTNLVDNAVRYNLAEGGHIGVRTRVAGDGNAELTVDNSGPAIAAYEIPGLFEPFRRLSGTDRQASQGTGLGLSIVRAVARAHGGEATAAPLQGGGLSVTVRLPHTP